MQIAIESEGGVEGFSELSVGVRKNEKSNQSKDGFIEGQRRRSDDPREDERRTVKGG